MHDMFERDIAFAPGLALSNRRTGAIGYEMSNGGSIIGYVSRRDIAETIRFCPEADNPSDEDRAGFRHYMTPPNVKTRSSIGNMP
ncbi:MULTISPECIES: hypothetical protein [Sphingomonadales]|uniref:hypothetical protein n=1 Tax=Sphingomonadales TaxID=204457 RepID=UPI0008245DAF|nr:MULTISPECIES: hypothetical protein [Sphingomonadales]